MFMLKLCRLHRYIERERERGGGGQVSPRLNLQPSQPYSLITELAGTKSVGEVLSAQSQLSARLMPSHP